jgi:dihydrodipicolinate synthase/N-acetylneuraminate lyase
MKQPKKCYGVIVPLITPFLENGDIDFSSLERILNHVESEITFPFILGTTGECLSMTIQQRKDLAKKTVEYIAGKKQVYAGISDNSLANSIYLGEYFHKIGVDIFVAHLPSYYPLSEKQIFNFFNLLADRSPRPVIMYNIPSTTHVSIPLHIVDELSNHPNIYGIKDSERSMERIKTLADSYSERVDFSVLSGWTTQSAHALMSGFDGIVPNTANLIPEHFAALYKAVKQSDKNKAEDIQRNINNWSDLYQKDNSLGEVFAALKVLMHDKNLCLPYLLPPLTQLDEGQVNELLHRKKVIENA